MEKDVLNELIKMKIALENLYNAFIECEETFESNLFDCNDYILGSKEEQNEYPFQLSFEEMTSLTGNWVSGCKERIDIALKEMWQQRRKEKMEERNAE